MDVRTIGIIVGILCALFILILAALVIVLLRKRCYRCYVYSRQALKLTSPPRGQGHSAYHQAGHGKGLTNGGGGVKPWRSDTAVSSTVMTSDLESERDVVSQLLKMELQASSEAANGRSRVPPPPRELPLIPARADDVTRRDDVTDKVMVNIPLSAASARRLSTGLTVAAAAERQMTSTLPVRRPKYATSVHGMTVGLGGRSQGHRGTTDIGDAYATLDANHTRSLLARDPRAPFQADLSVLEFPRDNLRLVEKLGGGQFGEVSRLCVVYCLCRLSALIVR